MKKTAIFLAMVFLLGHLSAGGFAGIADDDFRQALYEAIDKIAPDLKQAPLGKQPVAVLPMKEDKDNLVPERLRNLLTRLGFVSVIGREETEALNTIYAEIANSERKEDIFAPSTLVKFGKLKNTRFLMHCRVLNLNKDANRILAEIELRIVEIATGKRVWGGTFTCRYYPNKNSRGGVKIDSRLRIRLKKEILDLKSKLNAGNFKEKMGKVSKIVIIPVIGDDDNYITDLVIQGISETQYFPERTSIPSIAQYRYAVKDKSVTNKIVFYGVLRDLKISAPAEVVTADGKRFARKVISGELQFFIEDAERQTVLWSRNITFSEAEDSELPPLPRDHSQYLWIAGGVVAVLFLLFIMFLITVKLFSARNTVR